MPYERSAGAVIYYENSDKIKYLLMQYRHRRWDFPRGHVEPGETDEETARREIKEETGLAELRFAPDFKIKAPWFYKRKSSPKANYKEVIYFLAGSKTKKIMLNYENLGYQWLAYEQALALPMYPHVKDVLRKANDFLRKK